MGCLFLRYGRDLLQLENQLFSRRVRVRAAVVRLCYDRINRRPFRSRVRGFPHLLRVSANVRRRSAHLIEARNVQLAAGFLDFVMSLE